ncbi:hypothetical protein U1Q18_014865 [Sarracenia purpurea var. burkii]
MRAPLFNFPFVERFSNVERQSEKARTNGYGRSKSISAGHVDKARIVEFNEPNAPQLPFLAGQIPIFPKSFTNVVSNGAADDIRARTNGDPNHGEARIFSGGATDQQPVRSDEAEDFKNILD